MSISTVTPDQDLSVDGAPLPTTPISTLVLMGASGDLANRLLMPALGKLLDVEPQRRDLVLVGAGAEDWDAQAWRDRLEGSLTAGEVSRETIDALLATTSYHRVDVTKAEDLARLVAAGEAAPALYFALPPAVTAKACEALGDVDLPEGTVLVLEKPFGTDEASARALNAAPRDARARGARSSASTTSSAARRCSTSSACASPTASSSPSGTPSTSRASTSSSTSS